MNIQLFKKPYVIRHYEAQTVNADGYASAPYTDTAAMLNVQPLSPDDLMALPEGDRTVKRVKAIGKDRLASADEFTGTPGDRLFYQGYWYECKSSVMWDHTALGHYRSDFAILPPRGQEPPPEGTEP